MRQTFFKSHGHLILGGQIQPPPPPPKSESLSLVSHFHTCLYLQVYFANVHPKFPEGGKFSQHLDSLEVNLICSLSVEFS